MDVGLMEDKQKGSSSGRARTVVEQRWAVSWAPGLVISEFWGSLRQEPELFAEQVDRLTFTLANAIHELDGPFVSLIDATEVTEVSRGWMTRTTKLLRNLPASPERRAFVGGEAHFGTVQAMMIRAATLGRVRVFDRDARAQACEWLAEAKTCDALQIDRLWGRR